jgi:tetratricopeptide (TPR) repeat protein/transcriptional regulator with XRE-family HTH domain
MTEEAEADKSARRERLAKRRRALGLTQEALAAVLGVERSTVLRWERGDREPLPSIRSELADALRLSVDELEELLTGGGGEGSRAALTLPRQLPAAVTGFSGRAMELKALTAMMEEAGAGGPGTVVISAIGGTAGVGKTALALHWAHEVADRFGDGQLYVNLRGFDFSGVPAGPAEAVRGFLDALGVPPERIPASPDAQAGLYRSLLADKRMLIVLDNARDEAQVRPLLPASPASLVVVTSRSRLAGLAAADGARLLGLDVLTRAEAIELLAARLGAARAAAEPGAVGQIADMCAHLPLALTVAAARAAARPRFPLAALAAELRDVDGRLDALDSGDPAGSVRTVFSWSYRQLSPAAARLFRLLGLHPGTDVSVTAAASMAGCPVPQARRLLAELARDCLITEHAPDRWAFHDLLAAYAAAEARDTDSQPDQDAATGRLLDHYLHTAAGAALALNLSREQLPLAAPLPGVTPEQLTGHQRAGSWFETELHTLLAAVALAAQSGFDRPAWQLPWAMSPFMAMWGHFQQWAAIQRTALAAAARACDLEGQAVSSRHLAHAYLRLDDNHSAVGHFTAALAFYQQLGDRLGEALAQQGLAEAADYQGRHADAVGHGTEALRLFEVIGHKAGQARMCNNAGWFYVQLGDYQQARRCCEQALTLSAEAGEMELQCSAWDCLGYVAHQLGNFGDAVACYQRALTVCRELSAPVIEVDIATHLGDTHHAAGELLQAADAWRRALCILDYLNHPGAEKIRAKLAEIGTKPPGA